MQDRGAFPVMANLAAVLGTLSAVPGVGFLAAYAGSAVSKEMAAETPAVSSTPVTRALALVPTPERERMPRLAVLMLDDGQVRQYCSRALALPVLQ